MTGISQEQKRGHTYYADSAFNTMWDYIVESFAVSKDGEWEILNAPDGMQVDDNIAIDLHTDFTFRRRHMTNAVRRLKLHDKIIVRSTPYDGGRVWIQKRDADIETTDSFKSCPWIYKGGKDKSK